MIKPYVYFFSSKGVIMKKIEDFNLPEWLKKELPKPQEPSILSYTENEGYISTTHEGANETFDTIEEAYDYITNILKTEVTFDESLPEKNDKDIALHNTMLFIKSKEEQNFSRALMSHTDEEKIESLEESYVEFLKIAEKYENNREDFMTCYEFVDSHPAFWHKISTKEKFYWETYGYCQKIWSYPMSNEDNNTFYWSLEAGMHVEPEYVEHYHDWRIDSSGETIEKAYIKLAKNVYKYYNLDGTENETEEFDG